MINVAIMGYGVVGGGVADVIDANSKLFADKVGESLQVKYILDIRDLPGDKNASRLIKDFNIILNDKDVSIVVETIGGCKAAFEFTKQCLSAGKSVITSNKELVSKHGPELFEIADKNNTHYFFEASVGGGIPIIRPLSSCLCANNVTCIKGILNGTTNYMLTKMCTEHQSFENALSDAQRLGYAEADPSADIEGKDAARKIAILSDIAYGKHIDPDVIYTRGISDLTDSDMRKADREGFVIKLLGCSYRYSDKSIGIFVSPCAISKNDVLAHVNDVYNGIVVSGDMVGDVSFIGKGAGKLATASAVCSDIIDAAIGEKKYNIVWKNCGESFIRDFNMLGLEFLEGTKIPIIR